MKKQVSGDSPEFVENIQSDPYIYSARVCIREQANCSLYEDAFISDRFYKVIQNFLFKNMSLILESSFIRGFHYS